MKYTAEQIKPKRYPDEKPSEDRAYVNYRVLLDNGTQSLFNWNPISQSDGKMIWNKYVTWFIDIPNPPDELKFLAYPQNKPEQDGEYWTHHAHTDEWKVHEYKKENLCWWKAGRIDYFINVRLDKENELDEPLGNSEQLEREDKVTYKPKDKFSDYTDEDLLLELINRNVMFEASKKTERFVRHYEVFVDIGDDNIASIILPQDSLFELREIVYDKQSSNPCQLESEDEMELKILVDWRKDKDAVNLNTGRMTKGDFRTICTQFLDAKGYDVVKRGESISSDKYDYKFALERIRTWTCNDGRGYEDPVALLENIDDYINKVLDVVKREPEIAPCPFCGGKCKVISRIIPKFENQYDDRPDNKCSVYCLDCKYFGPVSKGDQEAIRLHNLIADNALLRKESW